MDVHFYIQQVINYLLDYKHSQELCFHNFINFHNNYYYFEILDPFNIDYFKLSNLDLYYTIKLNFK